MGSYKGRKTNGHIRLSRADGRRIERNIYIDSNGEEFIQYDGRKALLKDLLKDTPKWTVDCLYYTH